jgi:hypothetical protein
MQNRNVNMEVINPYEAGIGVGSALILLQLATARRRLTSLKNEIKTRAMESTGTSYHWTVNGQLFA